EQRDARWAARTPHNFDIDPSDAAAPACAERFHRSFFGGKPAGVALVFVLEALAVLALALRIYPAQERLAVALDCRFHAVHFCNIYSKADDHGASEVRANCDYTDRP